MLQMNSLLNQVQSKSEAKLNSFIQTLEVLKDYMHEPC